MNILHTAALLVTLLVALEHLYILVLEMFLWNTPRARRIFGHTEAFGEATRTLAANQGLYNGFLAAGLLYGLFSGEASFVTFFLLCVVVAGVFGAVTAKPRILLVQAGPALLALALQGAASGLS